MAQFYNNWIYTLDTTGDLTLLTPERLPQLWRDPVDGTQYGDLYALNDATLNSIGWYKVMEERPVITNYEVLVLTTRTFSNNEFLSTYIANYKTLEEVRTQKKVDLEAEKDNYIEGVLDSKTLNEKFYSIYRSLNLLIAAFADANPQNFVNNNSYLQNVLSKSSTLITNVDDYNSRITQVDIETDIPTIIAL